MYPHSKPTQSNMTALKGNSMKHAKLLLVALAAGALASLANQASAFPLYLSSLSGTISYTPSYSDISNTNKAAYSKKSVNLKAVMSVVSNTVYLATGTTTPSDARIAFDPITDTTYLTNSSGYSYNLSVDFDFSNTNNIARMELEDMATSFHSSGNGGSERDAVVAWFYARGYAADGYYYEIDLYGQGSLSYSADAKTGTKGSMTVSLSGADYGEVKSSDDGVAKGSVSFKGSGTPEWNTGPFSLWWD
jgi:hypothetical protein